VDKHLPDYMASHPVASNLHSCFVGLRFHGGDYESDCLMRCHIVKPLKQCCPTFLCTRAYFTDAYGGAGATTLLLLLLLLLLKIGINF
jgi:hypothetical protein